jgi:hypothetical protein
MPREAQRKSTRVEVAAPRLRDPRIQEHTRFINARGSRNDTATANALKDAFGVGSDFLNQRTVDQNEEGTQRAAQDLAFGRDQDPADENAGYQRGWSRLRAENDFNSASKEFGEFLRGADFENLEEGEVQEAYNTFMGDRFKGAEEDPEYSAHIAPKLVELELQTLADHRDLVIQGIQTEQSAMIFENIQERYTETGEFDYEYLAEETGRFFDGADKNVKYAEMLFDTAIEAGDPSIIQNMPERFPSGQPTIKNRPDFQDEIRAAEAAAFNVAARKLAASDAALEQANKDDLFDTQLLIANKIIAGQPVHNEIEQLRGNPEASFSTLTSSVNFGQAQLDEGDSRSPDLPIVATTWQGIYSGRAGLEDVMQMYADGVLGSGPQAVSEVQSMLSAVQQIRQTSTRGDATAISTYRSEITKTYNPQLQGPLGPLDPVLMNIQNEALSEYNRRVIQDGESPRVARDAVREQFDAAVDRIGPAALSESGSASQSANARSRGLTITTQDAQRFASGDLDAATFIGPRSTQEIVLQIQAISSNLSQEELNNIARQLSAQ